MLWPRKTWCDVHAVCLGRKYSTEVRLGEFLLWGCRAVPYRATADTAQQAPPRPLPLLAHTTQVPVISAAIPGAPGPPPPDAPSSSTAAAGGGGSDGVAQSRPWWGARLLRRQRPKQPAESAQPRLFVRISAQVYNRMEDYERLASALEELALKGG